MYTNMLFFSFLLINFRVFLPVVSSDYLTRIYSYEIVCHCVNSLNGILVLIIAEIYSIPCLVNSISMFFFPLITDHLLFQLPYTMRN